MKKLSIIGFYLLLSLYANTALAFLPSRAEVGDTISLNVSPSFFNPDEKVWVKLELGFQQNDTYPNKAVVIPMSLKDSLLSSSFVVPENLAMATCLYLTRDTVLIEPNTLRIIDREQNYVKHARLLGRVITGKSYAMLMSELSEHPTHLEALRQLWLVQNQRHSNTAMRYKLKKALPELSRHEKSPRYFVTAIWGYARLGNTKKAFELIDEFSGLYPDSPLRLELFDIMEKFADSRDQQQMDQFEKQLANFLVAHPDIQGGFNYGYLLAGSDSSLASIERFYTSQLTRHGNVPLIFFHAAQTFQQKLAFTRAISYGVKARALLSSGDSQSMYFLDRFHGQNYPSLWPHLTKTLVISLMAGERYEDALVFLKTGYSKSQNLEIDAELWALEARCQEMVKNYAESEKLYVKAYQKGLKWTRDGLRDLYFKRNRSSTESEFEAYFKNLITP